MSGKFTFRRGAAVLVLASLLFSLSACSKSGAKSSDSPPFQGTLTLWTAPGLAGAPGASVKPGSDWFAERAKAYEAEHKGVTVQVRSFATPAELEQALSAPGAALPDMAFGRFLPALAPRMAGIDAALTEADRKDYLPGALGAFRRGEQQLGIPVLQEQQVLLLNDQAFADAKVALPANGKWSLTEFENSLRSLSHNGRYGLGFYALPAYHEWWPLAAGLFAQDGAVADGAAEGIARLVKYRQDGLLHPDTAKVKADEIWGLFAGTSPAIAVLPAGTWAIPLLRDKPYNVKFTVAGFPGDTTVGYTYGFSVFQAGDQAHARAAASLAQFMAAPDQQVRLARETGLMPVRKSAGNPFEGDDQLTRAYQLAATQRPLPAGPAWDQAEAAFAQPLRLALLGAQEPKVALAAAAKLLSSATTPAAKP